MVGSKLIPEKNPCFDLVYAMAKIGKSEEVALSDAPPPMVKVVPSDAPALKDNAVFPSTTLPFKG